jgi:hypothetical protein
MRPKRRFAMIRIILLLTAASSVCYADNLQRLFTTPDERIELDRLRNRIEVISPDIPEPPKNITFNGIIIRDQTPIAVWVNGSPETKQEGFSVQVNQAKNTAIPIFLSKSGREAWLQPGQTVNTQNDKIVENFDEQSNDTEE